MKLPIDFHIHQNHSLELAVNSHNIHLKDNFRLLLNFASMKVLFSNHTTLTITIVNLYVLILLTQTAQLQTYDCKTKNIYFESSTIP